LQPSCTNLILQPYSLSATQQ